MRCIECGRTRCPSSRARPEGPESKDTPSRLPYYACRYYGIPNHSTGGSAMKIGYFANQNDLGLRKPFHQVMAETREIARTCDAAGWDSIWFTEHHFGFEGYEVCPNPVLMSADIAAHTKR